MNREKEVRFKLELFLEGEFQMQQGLNVTLQVNPATAPGLVVTDANGNPLADGATVALVAETVGVADPGQVVFNVSGGTAPYNFALSSGALPAGDSLSANTNADGSETVSISGIPTVAGAAAFSLAISDSSSPVPLTRKLDITRK